MKADRAHLVEHFALYKIGCKFDLFVKDNGERQLECTAMSVLCIVRRRSLKKIRRNSIRHGDGLGIAVSGSAFRALQDTVLEASYSKRIHRPRPTEAQAYRNDHSLQCCKD